MEVFHRIRERNQKRWGDDRHEVAARVGNELHTDRADLVGEVIQNAEDAGAKAVGFDFHDDGLLVWNDGHPFRPDELTSICGLWDSHKSFGEAGYFGIGFKVVLSVCNEPLLWSGTLSCKLAKGLDPEPAGKAPAFIAQHLAAGHTCVWLPWRKSVNTHDFYKDAKARLEEAAADSLAFMQSLERIELRRGTAIQWYGATRKRLTPMTVTTLVHDDANQRPPREWLVFSEEQPIPAEVMNRLAERAAEQSARAAERLRNEKSPRVPLQLAFALEGEELQPAEGRVFARIPTKEKTQLPFHINSRFPTNLARDHVRWGDPLTEWLATAFQAAAERAVTDLLALGFTGPRIVLCVPKKTGLAAGPQAIATAYRTKLQGSAFVLDHAGKVAHLSDIRLAHNQRLYTLLSQADLEGAAGGPVRWPSVKLREAPYSDALRDLGCKDLEVGPALAFLGKATQLLQRADAKDWPWFQALYQYLDEVEGKAAKLLSDGNLVPVRNGGLVKMSAAVLPPDPKNPPPADLVPYLEELPIVPNDLAWNEAAAKVLRKNKASAFEVRLVFEVLFAQSDLKSGADAAKHLRHVTLLYQSWQRKEIDSKFLGELGRDLVLLDAANVQHKAGAAYLPTELGGHAALDTYFRLAGSRPVLSSTYKQVAAADDTAALQLREFLQALGAERLPRATLTQVATGQAAINRAATAGVETPIQNSSDWKYQDWKIDGLKEALEAASKPETRDADRLQVWSLLAERASLSGILEGRASLNVTYYRSRSSWTSPETRAGTAQWLLQASQLAWLPNTNGDLFPPTELIAVTEAPILGPGPNYLSQPWLETESQRRLAENLGIRLKADMAGTVAYLRALAPAPPNPQTWTPIFAHLATLTKDQPEATTWLASQLQAEPLIPATNGTWNKLHDICWHDALGVVPQVASQNPPPGLKTLLVDRLELAPSPSLAQYSAAVQARAKLRNIPDSKTTKKLYQAIWGLADDGEHPAFIDLVHRPCWIARGIDGLDFVSPNKIVYNDHDHRMRLFCGLVHDLPFDGLLELARAAGMISVRNATPVVVQAGTPTLDPQGTARLAELWPYIAAFTDLAVQAPPVLAAQGVQVAYELQVGPATVQSLADDTAKSLLVPQGLLVDAASTGPDLPDLIGDALEVQASNAANLREFTKDLWNAPADALDRVLTKWERRLGRSLRPASTETEPDIPIAQAADASQEADVVDAPSDAEGASVKTTTSRASSNQTPRQRSADPATDMTAEPVTTHLSVHAEQHWSAPVTVEDLEPVLETYVPSETSTQEAQAPRQEVTATAPDATSPAGSYWTPYVPETRFSEAARKAVGRWGERYAYKGLVRRYEEEMACPAVPVDCGVQFQKGPRTVTITWHNMHDERGIGHDIVIQDGDVTTFYEVKATTADHSTPFQVTAREWELAVTARANYFLARVSRAGTADARCELIADPVGRAASNGFRRVQPLIQP